MIRSNHYSPGRRNLSRKIRVRGAILTLSAIVLLLGTACDQDEAMRAFRDAASSSLQSGLKSMFDGVIDGAFAVLTLGTDQSGESDTGSTGGSGG